MRFSRMRRDPQDRRQRLAEHRCLAQHSYVIGVTAIDSAISIGSQHIPIGQEMQVREALGLEVFINPTEDRALLGRRGIADADNLPPAGSACRAEPHGAS